MGAKGESGGRFVKWFSELSNKDISIAGGKGASLAEMYNSKFPIPPGFMITAQAYSYFIEKSGLIDKIKEKLYGMDMEDTEKLEQVSSEIRAMISNSEMPIEMESEIIESYELLDANKSLLAGATQTALGILNRSREPPFVAVRSSATTEDLADASFAGQQESFVNVKGKTELIRKVKECFASLFTARAVYYREKKGFGQEKAQLAVVVQKMVNSDKSGVIFSRNPITMGDTIMLEAVWGLGEGIVSGRIKPDNYLVDGNVENFKILETSISEKKVAITRNSSGENQIVKLTSERANQQVLSTYEIKILSIYAKQLEEHYKKPQDIEFAISGKDIYIVQSRPITTLGEKKTGKELVGEILLSGLGASPGMASGNVRIIYTIDDLKKIQKGDVLVTEMTNPDMVVSMQKACAIVTDEGGITCFSGDTNVLTPKGFMTIKETTECVNEGNEMFLLAYDSLNMKPVWKRVVSAAGRKRSCMRISVSQTGKMEDNYIDLTPDHKMITFEDRKLVKEQIDTILSNDKHICLIDSLPASNRAKNPKMAYLIGALMSDGNIKIDRHETTGNPRRGRITFTQKDIPQKELFINTVRDYFEECFGDKFKDGRIKYSHGNLRGRVIQGFASDYICNNLEVAQIITKISQNLDSWILRLDNESCLNFLAGLIDGDGCFYQNRLHIYADKENVLQGIILACLNLGIFPQITKNRTIHHIQILEKLQEILSCTKRVKGEVEQKINGNKLFSAKQILGDIADEVNYKGRIKPYIDNNLLLDFRKIESFIIPLAEEENGNELSRVINSDLRMQRVRKICDIGEIDVYNLEIEADNEIDHNFIAFTKKYTPLLVSNSHAAIVSREMGIPAVVGTGEATKKLKDGDVITVDGYRGKVFAGHGETKVSEVHQIVPTKTKIKVMVDLPDFADRAAKSGAKEVGLTRLEGIIAESGKHPLYFVKNKNIEEYSRMIYNGIKKIAKPFEGIWVRSSDIRSDEYRNLEGAPKIVEGNPMLGNHGIRFGVKNKDILRAEIAAIIQVAKEFPEKQIGLMMPQVISVDELKETKKIASELEHPENFVIGIMVETPAAVQIINDLCLEGISFISFGTNDLTQYMLAIDRNNSEVQYIYDEMNPAVLSALSYVIRRCRRYGVKTSICGQAGSKEEMVRFLVGEGIDSISVNADAAEGISKLVAELEGEKPKQKEIENILDNKKETIRDMPKEEVREEKNVEEAVDGKKNNDLDIPTPSKKEGEEDYSPGDSDKGADMPKLNDAIPVESSMFNDDREKKKKDEDFDLHKELEKA